MISYDFVPISSQKGVLFFETPGMLVRDAPFLGWPFSSRK